MSLFLLVSIGSVCAEKVAADDDIQSADGESVDVLADESNNIIGEDTTPEKINTTVNTDKDEYKYSNDDVTKNITVNVKDNATEDISIGKDNLTVTEGKTALNFTYANSVINLTDKLSVGLHNITIKYLGNDIYNASSKTVLLKISGEKTLIVDNVIVINNDNIEIPVKVFDGVDYLNVSKTDFGDLTLTYTNTSGNRTNETIDFNVEDNIIKTIIGFSKLVAASITINYTDAAPKTILIKINTTVNAEDIKIKETEDKNLTITVTHNEGTLAITKNDLKIVENGKDIPFNYNNSIITFTSLAKGVHTIIITYLGNETYYSSNKTVTVKVWGNQTIDPSSTATIDADKNVEIDLGLSDGADPVDIVKEKLTLTLFYTVGNVTHNRTFTQDQITIDGQKIKLNIPETFGSAYVDIKYAAENNLTGKTTIKVETIIYADDFTKGESEVKNFTIEVKGSDGKPLNITSSNLQILNNGKAVKFTYNDSVIKITDTLKLGIYNLTIKYTGNVTYSDATKNIILKVYGINATTSLDVNSTKKGEIKINITDGNTTYDFTKDDLTINATTKSGNNTTAIQVSWNLTNGTLFFELENGNFTTATLSIKYNNTELNVTLNRIYNVKIIPMVLINEYQNGNFTFRVTDEDDNTTSFKGRTFSLMFKGNISTGHSTTIDENNIASFKTINLYIFDQSGGGLSMKQLEVGNYTTELSTDGNMKSTKVTTNLTIVPANIKIAIEPYKEYYGSTKKVKITVTNAKNGEPVPGIILHLYMPQTSGKDYYFQTSSDGVSEIGVSGLVGGTYDLTVSNNDTKNINKASTKSTITILQIPVKITTSNLVIYYNSGNTATIKITDKATGKALSGVIVLVQLDKSSKKTYLFQTNNKGTVSFAASLAVGKHPITISTADTRYLASTVSKTITVKKASAYITAKKVTDYYKGVKTFNVKLTNSKTKKAIYDAKINIKVYISKNKYYNYNGKTGSNGQIKLLLNTLNPGKYKVVVSCADTKSYTAKKVTTYIVIKKAPAKLVPKKLVAKKKAKKYFKVTVKNKKTKKVIAGVKVKIKVYTGKKFKTYTKKTNSKGIAKLLTKKLKVGKHKVIVTSANKYVTAKQAKSTIRIKR